MTNREAGINVVREMMGDQAAAKLSASADSNTFGAPIAVYAVENNVTCPVVARNNNSPGTPSFAVYCSASVQQQIPPCRVSR